MWWGCAVRDFDFATYVLTDLDTRSTEERGRSAIDFPFPDTKIVSKIQPRCVIAPPAWGQMKLRMSTAVIMSTVQHKRSFYLVGVMSCITTSVVIAHLAMRFSSLKIVVSLHLWYSSLHPQSGHDVNAGLLDLVVPGILSGMAIGFFGNKERWLTLFAWIVLFSVIHTTAVMVLHSFHLENASVTQYLSTWNGTDWTIAYFSRIAYVSLNCLPGLVLGIPLYYRTLGKEEVDPFG